MDEESIQKLYAWIDEITLSRPKRNIARDFSDGVLAAEIIGHFAPNLVEIHNYTPANNSQQKRTNWETLNRKVFKKLDFNVPSNIINGIIMCKPGVIEIVLFNLRVKIMNYKSKMDAAQTEDSESDYNGLSQEPDVWNNTPYYNNIGPSNGPYPGPQPYTQPHQALRHQPHQPAQHFKPNYKQGYSNNQKENTTEGPLPHSINNGTIPFEGEKVKKKKSPKKKKNPGHHSDSQRSRSMPSSFAHLDHESRIFIQEKEQALLHSQETVHILQSKISRLEHLLQLKDLRIEDLDMKLKASLAGRPSGMR